MNHSDIVKISNVDWPKLGADIPNLVQTLRIEVISSMSGIMTYPRYLALVAVLCLFRSRSYSRALYKTEVLQ